MKRRRHILRLQGFDYSSPGRYFVTININRGLWLLGTVVDAQMRLSPPGEMVKKWVIKISEKFSLWTCSEYVIMPNHIQILFNKNKSSTEKSLSLDAQETHNAVHHDHALPEVIQWLKTMATNEYIRGVRDLDWEPFQGRLWQRSFYDIIVQDDISFENIVAYIQQNPEQWKYNEFF